MNVSTIKKSSVSLFIAAAFLAVSVALPFSVGAAPGKSEAAKAAAKPGTTTIVGIVLADDEEFDVLQAAVAKAGLVSALSGTRQFTVFAPTDAAFIKTLDVDNEAEALAKIASMPNADLTNILTYHVMSGRHTSTSVLARDSYKMLNNSVLTQVELAEAGIAQKNISASNGVIHVINSVLIP